MARRNTREDAFRAIAGAADQQARSSALETPPSEPAEPPAAAEPSPPEPKQDSRTREPKPETSPEVTSADPLAALEARGADEPEPMVHLSFRVPLSLKRRLNKLLSEREWTLQEFGRAAMEAALQRVGDTSR